MKVKPVDPNAVIRDPHTRRQLPPDGDEVPENTFWTRRLRDGEVVRVEVVRVESPSESAEPPVGNEPVAPLTTRARR